MSERLIYHDWHHAFDEGFERTGKIEGFTKKQRLWIIHMWDTVFNAPPGYHVCAFPVVKDGKFYLHGFVKEVHIHHIMPKGYAWNVLGWDKDKINSVFNAIPLCPLHHNGKGARDMTNVIHPDMEHARRTYQGKEHPPTYDDAFAEREKLMAAGQTYWNESYDQALAGKAKEVYHSYLNWQLEKWKEIRDPWPERKRRTYSPTGKNSP